MQFKALPRFKYTTVLTQKKTICHRNVVVDILGSARAGSYPLGGRYFWSREDRRKSGNTQ